MKDENVEQYGVTTLSDKEYKTVLNNFVNMMFVNAEKSLNCQAGGTEFVEEMLRQSKLMDLRVKEKCSDRSFRTRVEIFYKFHELPD